MLVQMLSRPGLVLDLYVCRITAGISKTKNTRLCFEAQSETLRSISSRLVYILGSPPLVVPVFRIAYLETLLERRSLSLYDCRAITLTLYSLFIERHNVDNGSCYTKLYCEKR
jgi:hypothetical protein